MKMPYIGITGATTPAQVRDITHMFVGSKLATHRPMLGFLVSDIVLNEGEDVNHRHYVRKADLPNLVRASDGLAFNTIHYNTKNPDKIVEEVTELLDLAGYDAGLCSTVQMNVSWPLRKEIDRIRDTHPHTDFIMSLSSHTIGALDKSEAPGHFAENYNDVGYILIDPSRGKGESFDVAESCRTYQELRDAGYKGVIGIAGGLSGENVGEVVGRAKRILGHSNFSIDVQGKVRSGSENRKLTYLDMEKCRNYVRESILAF